MSHKENCRCAKISLLIYTLIFWIISFAQIFIALWMLIDPQRSYILDLVDFSEDEPLLKAAVYVALVTGAISLIVGFLGLCGSLQDSTFLMISFIISSLLTFGADLSLGFLAWHFGNKFAGDRMMVYLTNLAYNRYSRDYWVAPLLDTIQYYHQCCGGSGAHDYHGSFWYKTNTLRGTPSFVPYSCCKQTQYARPWHIEPIDPMCITYRYNSSSFYDSVNYEGCHAKLSDWLHSQTIMFMAIGFCFAITQIVGVCISLSSIKQLHTSEYAAVQAAQLNEIEFNE